MEDRTADHEIGDAIGVRHYSYCTPSTGILQDFGELLGNIASFRSAHFRVDALLLVCHVEARVEDRNGDIQQFILWHGFSGCLERGDAGALYRLANATAESGCKEREAEALDQSSARPRRPIAV